MAWAIAFFGYSLLLKPIASRSKIISYILGVLLILFSLNFHKTAALLPVVFILSGIKLKRRYIILLLLTFPLWVYITNTDLVGEILMISQDDTNLFNVETAQHYMSGQTGGNMGIAAKIQEILRMVVFYGFFLLCVRSGLSKNKNVLVTPKPIQAFTNVAFWIIYISSIFAFITTVSTSMVYYRFMNFAVFPISVSLSYLVESGQQYRRIRTLSVFAVMYTIYRLLYALYLSH